MHNSSVKWSHLGNFDPNSTTQFSLPILRGTLGHFELGSIFHNYYKLIVSWCLENKYNKIFKGI